MEKIRALANKVVTGVDEKKNIGDAIVAVLLALCPVFQHYNGIGFNLAITILVLATPYLFLRMLSKWGEIKLPQFSIVAVAIIYQIYRVIDHGTTLTEFGQSAVYIVFLMALALGCVNLKLLVCAAQLISLAASALLMLQYICFYLFGFHLQLVITSLLLPSAEQWILGAQTGLAGITGRLNDFYRPSAFFLEPSHVYIYMFPHLFVSLFGKGDFRRTVLPAVLITLGMVLTTSGMGIVVVVCAWGLYFLLHDEKTGTFSSKHIFRKRNLIMLGILVGLFVVAAIMVPPIRRTIARIFSTKTGVTAIGGRVSKALKSFEGMSVRQWIFGIVDTIRDVEHNMPGAIAAIYRHGLIGFVLSFEFYARSLFKQKLPYFLVSLVVIATSLFSAHTHSTVGMLYFTFILMRGYQTAGNGASGELKVFVKDFCGELCTMIGKCLTKIKGAKTK